MSHELSNMRASVDVGDGYERVHHVAQALDALESQYDGHGHRSDQEKLLPRVSTKMRSEQPAHLEDSLFRSLMTFSWLIHFVAVGCTAAAVQLTFNNTYWTDEADWDNRFLWSILRGTRIQDILQFAAKLYEVIVVLSLSSMVMHSLRRMLVGDGVAWGLLSGAYQVGAPTYLFSRELWAPFIKPHNSRNFFMALGLALLVVYANMIGPFTAIIISPILEWWPIHDPFSGQNLTTYVYTQKEHVYPVILNETLNWEINCETIFASANCPDSGFPEVKNLVDTWVAMNGKPSIQIKHAGAETARELTSSLEYSAENAHLAVATTLQSSVVEMLGGFWNYIDSDQTNFTVSESKRPRFTPVQVDDIFSPLVQVQCNHFSYNELRRKGGKPTFEVGRMRNLSSHRHGGPDLYKSKSSWDVPPEFWDFELESSDITFDWVSTESLGADEHPSVAAFVAVPMTRFETSKNGTVPMQDMVLIPCVIDARWASNSIEFDPSADNLISNDLVDFAKLSGFWDEKSSRPATQFSQNMLITPNWTMFLDKPTGEVRSSVGATYDGTGMKWLLDSFHKMENADDEELEGFTSFKTSEYTSHFKGDKGDVEAARAVATTLSLAMADAISRVSLTVLYGVTFNDNGNGTVPWKDLWLQSDDGGTQTIELNLTDVQGLFGLNWNVDRKGWGYGFKTHTIFVGVALLLLHSVVVVFFSLYVLWFRLTSSGWASGAWGGLGEMLGLAFASRKPSNELLIRNIAEGDKKWSTMAAPVFVRTLDDEKIELMLGDDNQGKRLTIGRAYST